MTWRGPQSKITQKPASMTMGQYWLSPNKLSGGPECFQKVATEFFKSFI